MAEVSAQIIALLRRECLFQGLEPDQLIQVAARFTSVTLEPGTIVVRQGDQPDFFYVVQEGHARVSRKIKERDRVLNVLGPGDFFGEQALIFRHLRSATITTTERATLLRLDQQQFHDLLQEFPQIKINLEATAQSRRLAQKIKFKWLGTDEVIYFLTRKHVLFLILGMILPVFFLLLSIPILVLAVAQNGNPLLFYLLTTIGSLFAVLSVLRGIWVWLDWENDFYIVTNQRVIWREKVIGLYDSLREAPLDTVLTVNIVSSQVGRILDYGNVEVKTFTGSIRMSSVHQAKLFAAFVECYRKRLTHLHREEESRTMHQSVENALQRARSTPQVVDTSTIKPSQAKPPVRPIRRKRTDWRFIFNTFLKMRYVQSGVITYRKHILILLQKTILPLLAFLLFLTTVIYYIIRWMQDGAAFINPLIFTLLAIPAFFAVLIWLGYHFVDWQNDIYQLTSDQILDIEKKPLGEESKKTGLLKDIQSIEHERENIIGIIFNFGTVTITVGQTRFYFYNVYNPDQVHQDIANARETLNRKNRAAEATRERERIVQWLVTLDEEQEKLRKVNENFEPKDERTG